MTEWMLALFLAGSKEPAVIATGYQTTEQCEMAGDLFKAADQAVRQKQQPYSIVCTEVEIRPGKPG